MFGKRQGGGRTVVAGNVLRTSVRKVLRFHSRIEFALLFLVTFSLVPISSIAASEARAETQYSSTPEYRALLAELHDTPVRPSRIGSGRLLTTPQPLVSLKVHENARMLRLESSSWHLEIRQAPLGHDSYEQSNWSGMAAGGHQRHRMGPDYQMKRPRRFISERYATFSVTKTCGECRLLSPVRKRLQLSRSRFFLPRSFDSQSVHRSPIPVRSF